MGAVVAAISDWPARRVIAGVMVVCGLMGGLFGGPVGAIATAAYGGLAVRAALRLRRDRLARQRGQQTLDALCSLAADLRAGLPPVTAWEELGAAGIGGATAAASRRDRAWRDDRIARLTSAAWRLGERTGAPLADLIERVEADARAGGRARAAASAQAAGARATAWLLGALPVGGLALGYAIGADPLHILLRTPLGAACALAALALQFAGLMWAERLGAEPRVS
jgi:tight adherence protein B